MPEVGPEGQRRLNEARVLCIGAGGLGSPAALYLAAAGIGKLGLVDFDDVDLSNLQRQILHGTKDVGRKKLESARDRLRDVNPNIDLQLHQARFTSQNARSIQAPLPFRADFRHDHVPRIPKLFVLRHLILTSSQLIPTIRLFSNRFNDFGKMR